MFRTKLFLLFIPIAVVLSLGVFSMTAKKFQSENETIACSPSDLTGAFLQDEKVAFFDNKKINAPSLAVNTNSNNQVLGVSDPSAKWIEVDLSDQKLKAWDGNQLFVETPISSGLPWTPTPTGEFRIWIKLRATKMEGGSGRYYYYLPKLLRYRKYLPWLLLDSHQAQNYH